jgi:hypothetical protein
MGRFDGRRLVQLGSKLPVITPLRHRRTHFPRDTLPQGGVGDTVMKLGRFDRIGPHPLIRIVAIQRPKP